METPWILNMVFMMTWIFEDGISWALIQEHPWGHGKIESIGAVVATWRFFWGSGNIGNSPGMGR